MQNVTLGDLRLALKDLSTARQSYFQNTSTYALYGPMLDAKRAAIEALPEALTSNRPRAQLLGEADLRHDDLGAAFFYLGEAILRHPDSPQELRERVRRVREAFVPRLGVLKEKYADEALAAEKKRAEIARYEDDLRAIPTPLGDSAYEWATAFVEAGERIGKLLSDRATDAANADASGAAALRGATIGLLGRARQALEDEVAHNPALPRNLVKLVFGYIDVLQSFREARPTGEPPPPESGPIPEAG